MSDILPLLRDLLLEQRESPELVSIRSGLMDQAEITLEELKIQYKKSGDASIMEKHEAIANALDELQETRADIIWSMAYHQSDETRGLTEREKSIYTCLTENAAKLRGIE